MIKNLIFGPCFTGFYPIRICFWNETVY